MVRGPRNREKLQGYYDLYMKTGQIDPNVNPEIAASWQKSREVNPPTDRIRTDCRLSPETFAARRKLHRDAMMYLKHLTTGLRDFFKEYDISLLLLDDECVVLKSYSMPFYQMTPGEIEGVRVGLEQIGTSSVSMACELQTPFWVFGPEMWIRESHDSDACSAPVFVDNKMCYIITMVGMHYENMPQEAVMAFLKTLVYGMEKYLQQQKRLNAQEMILDVVPFAVYHVLEDSNVSYANKLGLQRLRRIGVGRKELRNLDIKLTDMVINYKHTPIYKGLQGISSHNKEVTWITQHKTYEDITTVVPVERDIHDKVKSVVTVSMPIEDLRTMVAHAAGFTAKYSLSSLVCDEESAFASVKAKAQRVAKSKKHILLLGEAGTGKQRMAHGIHQASRQAQGPFIIYQCGDSTPDIMEQELFGISVNKDVSHPGKLELADGGTLFTDDIEKMPMDMARTLAATLVTMESRRVGESTSRHINVRIIAACDGELRRYVERGEFPQELLNIVAGHTIRLPALRNRKEDIGALAGQMLKELAAMHQVPVKVLTPEAVEKLLSYDWPGNIKQLQNVMESVFFNTPGTLVSPDDVDFTCSARKGRPWKEDKEVFVQLWSVAGGNISRLANMLNVSRVTLYRYLKKFGLDKTIFDK